MARPRPTKMHIIYFDSDVCHYDCFEDEEPVIKPHGGGGTMFSPIFKFMQTRTLTLLFVLYSQTW